ncbi:Serine-threonine/tyrosine-protein kinase [Hirschfeldia incana]|nr:Serine-threonine/tyrosine-protein kinase [Hirschfeldia incana]
MIDLFQSSTNSMFHIIIIWMLFVTPSFVFSADDKLHILCSKPFSCGDQTGLLYPFWISGREDCGHPDFKVNCSGGFAELSISSVKYRILEANYDSRIIRLARSDFIGNLCPTDPSNMPFNQSVLPLAPSTELLTIFYHCSQEFSQYVPAYFGAFACGGGDDDDKKDYYVTRNLSSPQLQAISPVLANLSVFCDKNVSIPASGPALNTLQLNSSTDDLQKALEEGFKLGLNQDCSICLTSGGACGFNRSSSGFICYNIEKANNRTRNNGLSTGAIVGTAIASVIVLLFLIAGCALCLIRRRKIQAAEYTNKDLSVTSYSSKEASSHPTPKKTSSPSSHALNPSISNFTNASSYFGVQVFSYEELEEATENFSRELGNGGFGTVYYGVLKDGRAVAVKRLYEKSLQRVDQFKNEIDILKTMKHPNLVILYGCTSRHSSELLLVYEYISNGTLADHLHGDRAEARPLCWPVRLNIAIETASAISFLHKSDQTHVSTMPQGTPGYVDPEYYQCYRLNEKSDVYSFGVVLAELISSKKAVDITRERHDVNLATMAVSKIQNNTVHELVDPGLGFAKDPEVKRMMISVAELAFRCLQHESENRPLMDEIVEILKGIKGGKLSDVVDIVVRRGDNVGLLRHRDPPLVSPDTDKWTSSSDTAASSF